MAELTPMMRQYMEVKEKNPDTLLFFRLGDFYEMFGQDARTASRELDLALTTRDKSKDKPDEERIPMCGVPYHSAEGYIARLIAKGYKVSICEQTEDPAQAKGLVQREVIRTVTPGTVLDDACLDASRGNYLCGVYLTDTAAGLCGADISTGQAQVTVFTGEQRMTGLLNELGRFAPAEAVLNERAYRDETLTAALENRFSCRRERLGDGRFDVRDAEKKVRLQFGEDALAHLPRNETAPLLALGGLLTYLYETQKTDLKQLDKLEWYSTGQFMELDLTARRNLELTETLRGKEKKGSLLWVLDKTKTAMGARNLRAWLQQPLLNVAAIDRRLNAVGALADNNVGRQELRLAMTGMGDMERLMSRIVYGTAGARDLVNLRTAIEHLSEIKGCLAPFQTGALARLNEQLETLEDVGGRIAAVLTDEPPFSVREGNMIREGYDPEVDRLRGILSGGKGFIAELEAREKEKTGIRTLKVGYNKVFGYYIEVSNSFKEQVPEEYIRKQTLVNGERYITQELKDLEHEVLTAHDRDAALEYDLFAALRTEVASQVTRVQLAASLVAQLDTLCAFAETAAQNHYCRPEVDESGVIEITAGRHPVVEKMRGDAFFVPNDTHMGAKEERVAIITGPNMAGKSTYMRQVALTVLMAQMGSFVPAQCARIGVVDRIFTRIGASDDLAAGQSTFMVEMNEVSELLRRATKNSLLILDEIGRGTSTFDGMSIARAVLEHCAGKLKAKTLFATHYHELTSLEQELPGVKNYNVAVHARGEDIVFLRKIVPGGADRSYGIEVAKLAGLPETVLKRAREILRELESQSAQPRPTPPQEDQVSLEAIAETAVADILRRTQVDALSPLEALNLLYELKAKLQ